MIHLIYMYISDILEPLLYVRFAGHTRFATLLITSNKYIEMKYIMFLKLYNKPINTYN